MADFGFKKKTHLYILIDNDTNDFTGVSNNFNKISKDLSRVVVLLQLTFWNCQVVPRLIVCFMKGFLMKLFVWNLTKKN